ncbi:MAG: sigma-54-dependent transcriptional regulator [Terriglobales bacterium]
MKPRILITDDEKLLQWALSRKCAEWGYETDQAETCAQALTACHAAPPDVLLLDVRLPDGNGVELLQRLRAQGCSAPAIMITADPVLDDIKAAMRLGAFDYLSKPVNLEELHITLANALETSQLREQVATLSDHLRHSRRQVEVIGRSPILRQLMDLVRRAAASPASVLLLQGESGTGKDLLAQVIHQLSPRAAGPYVPVNCAAIPESLLESEIFGHERGAFTDAKTMKRGLFELANGGSLFLDEIGELPLPLQSKLLRALEDQTVRRLGGEHDIALNLRVIAASNRNLKEEVAAHRFRPDLFYRLTVLPIFIPPLRSRKEDIPVLADFFIQQYNRRFGRHVAGLSPEAERLMRDYDWPGNVRELKNTIQRAMVLDDHPQIRADALPFAAQTSQPAAATAFPDPNGSDPGIAWQEAPGGRYLPELRIPPAGTSLNEIEKLLVVEALSMAAGNQSRAARLLDISRDTLRYAMKKFSL